MTAVSENNLFGFTVRKDFYCTVTNQFHLIFVWFSITHNLFYAITFFDTKIDITPCVQPPKGKHEHKP